MPGNIIGLDKNILVLLLLSKESDQVNRYLKKIEKDDSFLTSALYLSQLMEEKVKQNIAVEIYTDYFQEEDEATNWEQVCILYDKDKLLLNCDESH